MNATTSIPHPNKIVSAIGTLLLQIKHVGITPAFFLIRRVKWTCGFYAPRLLHLQNHDTAESHSVASALSLFPFTRHAVMLTAA
jgi:hypothetical protein